MNVHRPGLRALLAAACVAGAGCAGSDAAARPARGAPATALIADARADLRFDADPPPERVDAARRALLDLPGVAGATIEHGNRDVVVLYDSRHTDVDRLLATLAAAGAPAHVARR